MHATLKKIEDIHHKIEALHNEKRKLQEQLDHKILKILHTHNAFSYDINRLIEGITHILLTLQKNDAASQERYKIWKDHVASITLKKRRVSPHV